MSRRQWGQGIEPKLSMPRNDTIVTSTDPRLAEIFGLPNSATGMAVTEQSAMRVSAAYACARIIAGAVASMPVDVFRRDGAERRKLNEAEAIWWLLNEQPHPRWTASAFWKWVVKAELLRGDGFAYIRRNRNGTPVEIEPIVTAGGIVERREGRLRYFWTDEDGKPRGADQDDVLHFPGFGFDGTRGMSAIQWGARNGIGIALATDDFSGRFFGDGAMVKHVLKSPGRMGKEQVEALREQFQERYAGLNNAYKPMVLTEGLDVRELSLNAEDAQLLEARRFQIEDVARAFGVPPFMIGATDKTSSWGSGVEHMSLGFVKYTLQERLTGMEQELNRKLFRTAGRFAKFNADELLRGDSAARAKFLRELVGGSQGPGIITPNEARASEGWAAIDGGDVLYDPRTVAAAKGQPNA